MASNPNAKVFISYRREDAAGHAGRLYDRLKARFPGRVFIDVGEIAPGSDFVEAIERGVGECKVLVAIVGNSWLNGERLRDANDFVRLEIASALKRGIRVVPVLVRGARMPAAADLPEDLASLLRRQAISISDEDWDSGCERLIQVVAQDLGPAEKPRTAGRLVWILTAAGVIALAVAALLLRSYWTRGTVPDTKPGSAPSKGATEYVKSLDKSYGAAANKLDEIARKIAGEDKPAPAKEQPKTPFSPVGTWVLTRHDVTMKGMVWRLLADRQVVDVSRSSEVAVGNWEFAGDGQTITLKLSPSDPRLPTEMQVTSSSPETMSGKGSDGTLWDFRKSIRSQ